MISLTDSSLLYLRHLASSDNQLEIDIPEFSERWTDEDDLTALTGIVGQLAGEMLTYRRQKARVTGQPSTRGEHLYFDHDGTISNEQLDALNEKFKEIRNGTYSHPVCQYTGPYRNGNLIAAQNAWKYRGSVEILRVDDAPYFVRTELFFPF